MQKKVAPFGAWKSPVTSDLIIAGMIRLGQLVVEGDALYWTEGRPAEQGRNVIVRWTAAGGYEKLTPDPFDVCTRVHEYGGGAFTVRDGVIIFSNFTDQRLYRQRPGSEPVPVTPAEKLRFADGVFAPNDRFVCVREDHGLEGREPVNAIVSLALDGEDSGLVLASGNDFYAAPRVSPDGQQLAWLTWNHPHMPWDGTELWVGDFTVDGSLTNQHMVAGGRSESIFQPQWSPGGVLHFGSDRSGWWNLYRLDQGHVEALYPMEAEFGAPQWEFGMRTYAFDGADTILCAISQNGFRTLALLDTAERTLTPLDLPFTTISDLHVAGDQAFFEGGAPDLPAFCRVPGSAHLADPDFAPLERYRAG